MKKIEIYDPAMCCSTGVCGQNVDTELLRIATTIDTLKKQGADITRYNMASQPQAFVDNAEVNRLLTLDNNVLPVTLVDGHVVKTKSHLTDDEIYKYIGMPETDKKQAKPPKKNCCCGSDC